MKKSTACPLPQGLSQSVSDRSSDSSISVRTRNLDALVDLCSLRFSSESAAQRNHIFSIGTPFAGLSRVMFDINLGSVQWKEVERRRRETINEGITELKKIVPGSEKNKGEILKQAVRYIQRLKSIEIEDQEKWRLERMMMEGRMKDQREEIERLSREYLSLEVENESLKRWIIDLGERSRSDLPQLSIDHSIRTSQSKS
ncbi:hypothetical protein DFH28DRAFT_932398 [Melampsora americana]|nr:hypothetical protein DFH28DRAFT_932398 [Melampsora americana]